MSVEWCALLFNDSGYVYYYRQDPHPRTEHVVGGIHCSIHGNIEELERFQSITGYGSIKQSGNRHMLTILLKDVEPLFRLLQPYLNEAKLSDFRFSTLAYDSHDPEPTKADWERTEKKWTKKLNKEE